MMIRTQIYLPKTLYQDIDLIAKREKKPKAQVIRESIEKHVETTTHQETLGEALARLSKHAIKGLPSDLSSNIDKYLYEE
jgi:predicted DNA-binding protein